MIQVLWSYYSTVPYPRCVNPIHFFPFTTPSIFYVNSNCVIWELKFDLRDFLFLIFWDSLSDSVRGVSQFIKAISHHGSFHLTVGVSVDDCQKQKHKLKMELLKLDCITKVGLNI